MVIKRNEIWWAELPEPLASEPGYKHPVVVMQADAYNLSKIRTVIVVLITSNLHQAKMPGNVFLAKEQSGLAKDSVINVTQIITTDRSFLTKRISQLPLDIIQQVELGIFQVLALTRG